MFFKTRLQLFADGGDGGAAPGESAAAAGQNEGVTSAAAGQSREDRLRELGVPESKIRRRAKDSKPQAPMVQDNAAGQAAAADAADAPKRMSWDEIMADDEYNQAMQKTVQARVDRINARLQAAEAELQQRRQADDILAAKYGIKKDSATFANDLFTAINNDDAFYEDKALELGVDVSTAKRMAQDEAAERRRAEDEQNAIKAQQIQNHLDGLRQQAEKMKAAFPGFDLDTELQNPAFLRMTAPGVGLSVEDAYYAVHRKELQAATSEMIARKTAENIANNIRAGQRRPIEAGSTAQAPASTTFDYTKASRSEREALKNEIRRAAARGEKIYPGSFRR